MTVKEIRKYIFSGTPVRLVYDHKTMFAGYANELVDCEYRDSPIKADGICLGNLDSGRDIVIILASLKPKISIPKEFNSYEIPEKEKDRMIQPKIPIHVTVLDELVHYISKDRFYNIRVESKGLSNNYPTIKYRCVIEDELGELYSRGKE